ncbi:MAG: hypothetical protein KJS91_02795 [Planctomycetes bacterium]|nr:hypothetical protein [Planctomycetota bacterium]
MTGLSNPASVRAWCLCLSLAASMAAAQEQPFRPEPGKFPPLDKALAYRGELVFVDHANRRGSIRVEGAGTYFRNAPHPFAMLPYGVVRYHGAPAELRHIPLGTVLHVRGFLPPDPKNSPVPVFPVNNRTKNSGYSGAGTAPAENHVLLLEDEPSHCLREGLVWKLKEVEVQNNEGLVVATRAAKADKGEKPVEEKLTFDATTRLWRGRESLRMDEFITEGGFPASGKKSLDGKAVLLGINWKPTPGNIFTRFHISDIWLDDAAMERASRHQSDVHKAFIRSRWMPAWVDAVEYGKFGRAVITATLFGGMDNSLYADFKKGGSAIMNSAESTLKHTNGSYGPAHMASRGTLLDVAKASGEPPLGSSGIQIRMETDLIIEGIRPPRVVRVRPSSWAQVDIPREEYFEDGNMEERFPSPAIFPRY